MICRLRGHIPMSYGPDLQGNDTIICNRCGKSPAVTDVAVLGTERALQVAVIASLAALCTRFGESKVGA